MVGPLSVLAEGSRVVMREDSGVQCFAQEAYCGESSPILGNKGGRGSAAPGSITPGKVPPLRQKHHFERGVVWCRCLDIKNM